MRVRFEKTRDGFYHFGISFWRDEAPWFGPEPEDEIPKDYYVLIYLIFGYIEVHWRSDDFHTKGAQ